MSYIPIPATISDAPAASRPLMPAVDKQLGVAPNLFRLVSTSPAALEGCCLAARNYLGKNLAKLDDAEIAANRRASTDSQAKAECSMGNILLARKH